MNSRKAIITGVTGFVGSHLARHLLGRDWDVSVLVRSKSRSKIPKDIESAVTVIADPSNDASIDGLAEQMAGADVVFHLASRFLASHKATDISELIESNITSGTRLLEAMKQARLKRIVNTGTSWQNFESETKGALNIPVNLYAATKSAFEAMASYYSSAAGIQCTHLKLFDTYGPNDRRGKLIELLLKASLSGEKLAMSPGDQKVDLVHIDDVVSAFEIAGLRSMEKSNLPTETFSVCTGRPLSLKSLVKQIEISTGRKINVEFGARPYREREVMQPFDKGSTVPGWSPKISLEQGLAGLSS